MKCHYQNCDCRYYNLITSQQNKACEECELYSKDGVRISRGCAEPAIVIILIIILLFI